MEIPVSPIVLSHLFIWIIVLIGVNILGRQLGQSYDIIKRQAIMDALAGFPIFAIFRKESWAGLTISRRSDAELPVIMCDIDNLKKI